MSSNVRPIVIAILFSPMLVWTTHLWAAQNHRSLGAPTYYIAAEVKECNLNRITVRGATNLPTGALLSVLVSVVFGNEHISTVSTTAVDGNGHFTAEVKALPTKGFESNRLVAYVRFQPEATKQPKSVLNIVGRKGEKLDIINNPQAFQTSGWWYGLEEAALVGECFHYQ